VSLPRAIGTTANTLAATDFMRSGAPDQMQLDLFAADARGRSQLELGDGAPSGRKPLARWLAKTRCVWRGHMWRSSRSRPGLQTCARCHRRRMPEY
jgi:hypothetical protein